MLSEKLNKTLLKTTDNYIKALEKAWVSTVADLLFHFPRDYDDRTNVLDNFSLLNIKEKNTILVKLVSISSQKTGNNKLLTKAVLEDKNGFLSEAVWFNRKYLATQLKSFEDKKIIVSWKVKYAFWKVTFQSPEVETDLEKISGEIVPIYPELNYIPSKWIEWKILLLKNFIKDISEDLPEEIVKKYNFISKRDAVFRVHFPKNKSDIEQAEYRLAYGELFEINYKSIASKYEYFQESEGKSLAIKLNPDLVKKILEYFPFEFTNHQKIALFQILKDMEKNFSMQRLLEWDVWTWKTAVAFVAWVHGILESEKKSQILNSSLWISEKNPPIPNPFPQGEKGDFQGEKISSFGKNKDYIVELARKFRKNLTEAEENLWEILRWKKINWIKFRRQHPFWRYIADFYSDEAKLVVELDWKIHEKTKEYDELRDEIISKYWVKILRIKNEEIEQNLEEVLLKILEFLPPLGEGQRMGEEGKKNIFSSLLKVNVLGDENLSYKIQVAIMAPTEILARQHFEWMQNFLLNFWIKSELLVWSLTAKQKKSVKERLKNWDIDIIIWTHALVQEDVIFFNLWFVVVDEQHRFWVKQRETLEKWFWNRWGLIPHNLNMTATPIPRTLALTLYGDQDLSVISEYPKWRKEIFTKVAKNDEERLQIENFVRAEIEKWRQVFWISPLVEESEKLDLANAINTWENLKEIFFPFKVGLLHGKMKAKEKDEVMRDFAENKIQILSSTSVVEVWVNVPNATIICIEWAERFGLSQLHQFRWRVWRWKYQSYCYLFPSKWQYTDRLKAMEKTNNGFELAEIDLELRWPWEVYGLRQSWVSDLKIAKLTDLELISQIREDIVEIFENKKK